MRVLLRKTTTGQYYRSPNEWVTTREEAFDFERSSKAVLHSVANRMRDMEVLLTFDAPDYDIRLPLQSVLGRI